MSRQFMAYWKPNQPSFSTPKARLNHAASNKFKHCKVGDVVWIVTLEEGKLQLVGRIPVKYLVNHKKACQILDQYDLWPADWHIISDPKGGDLVRRIPIHQIAGKLRFVTATGKEGQVLMVNNRISGTALQSMRTLTDDSIDLFEAALKTAK